MKIYLGEYTDFSQTITKYRIDTNFRLKWEMLASLCILTIYGFKLTSRKPARCAKNSQLFFFSLYIYKEFFRM